MSSVTVQYEIKRDDYVDASHLLYRVHRNSYREMWMLWGCAALLLLIPFAYRDSDSQWTYPLLVIPFAAYLIYAALLYVFLTPGFRRNYKYSGLAGVSFIAEFSAVEVTVRGPDVCWITQWKGFKHIKESKSVFMFYDGFMMYIFAKRYFSQEQLHTLKGLMRLNSAFKP